MKVCEECQAERNKWYDAVQDLSASWICRPREPTSVRAWELAHPDAEVGQRGKRATEIVRTQIKLINDYCEANHEC